MVVRVLAELLDAPVEVPEDRVEIDDDLTLELEDDAQHAVRRRVLGPHVDEHLAVAEGVELGLAFGPRRVWRDRLEDTGVLVELDPRVIRRRLALAVWWRGRHARTFRIVSAVRVLRGAWTCSMWRTPAPGDRAASSGRKKSLRSGKLW